MIFEVRKNRLKNGQNLLTFDNCVINMLLKVTFRNRVI